jgi:hypothetical protein
MITSGANCTREIASRIAKAKATLNRMKTTFSTRLDLNLRKNLVKCYIMSADLYGVEIWTLVKLDQKYLGSFGIWCWRRMEKISWTDRVSVEVLRRIKEQRNILPKINGRKLKVKVNFTLEQATKAQRGSRGIALPFL